MTVQDALEVGQAEVGGIDNEVGPISQGRNVLALKPDAVDYRAIQR